MGGETKTHYGEVLRVYLLDSNGIERGWPIWRCTCGEASDPQATWYSSLEHARRDLFEHLHAAQPPNPPKVGGTD